MNGSNSSGLAKYRLMERLGKGAFGEVYKGFDIEQCKMVALKMVRLNEQEYRSFRKQVSMLKTLKHPYVVELVDCIRHHHQAIIVLQYLQGGSLLALIQKGSLPESVVAKFIRQVLQGLAFLHNLNIVHRDIKAANLLLDKNGGVKLADFGVAKQLKDESLGESAKGSPYWMAPEVISLGSISTSCDIWSLGCTTIQLLTGKCPYSHLLPYPAMVRIVEDQSPPLPPVSPLATNFLKNCLIKQADKRASAEELLEHPWLRQESTESAEMNNHAIELLEQLSQVSSKEEQEGRLIALTAYLRQKPASFCKQQQYFVTLFQPLFSHKPQQAHLLIDLLSTQLLPQCISFLAQSGLLHRTLQLTHHSHSRQTISAAAYFLHELSAANIEITIKIQPYESLSNLLTLDYTQMKEETLLAVEVFESIIKHADKGCLSFVPLLAQRYDMASCLMVVLEYLISDCRQALGKFTDKVLAQLVYLEESGKKKRTKRVTLFTKMLPKLMANKNVNTRAIKLATIFLEERPLSEMVKGKTQVLLKMQRERGLQKERHSELVGRLQRMRKENETKDW